MAEPLYNVPSGYDCQLTLYSKSKGCEQSDYMASGPADECLDAESELLGDVSAYEWECFEI